MSIKVSLKDMIEAGAHFGHQARRWNPKMKEFIYGEREGIHIFDLTKTKVRLEEALEVITQTVKDGKKILILGTKKQVKNKVGEVARLTNSFYVNERWLGGTITNFEQILKSTNKLSTMKDKMAKGEYGDYTKKERLLLDREIQRLERFFGGIAGMEEIPDLLIIVDTKREQAAIKEAQMKNIPVVGIVDTNCDPDLVDYPIPMNDDATRALDYVMTLVQEALLVGKKKDGDGLKKSKKKGTSKSTKAKTKKKK